MPPTDPSAADGSVDEPSAASAGSRGFPREARLLDGRSYDAVFGENRRLADRHWTLLVHRRVIVPAGAPPADAPDGSSDTSVAAGPDASGPGPDQGREDEPSPPVPPPARLGLAVAKKRARRAVDRNRIKRVARESFRHVRAELTGLDVVIMNRDAAKDATAPELRRSLDALWSRLLRQSPDERRGPRESTGQGRRRRDRGAATPSGAGRNAASGDATGATPARGAEPARDGTLEKGAGP